MSDQPTPAIDARTVFSLSGVSKTYTMGALKVEALKATDLDLYGGELVVLLGASGSGKSTLLNILGGLDLPSAGRAALWRHTTSAGADDADADPLPPRPCRLRVPVLQPDPQPDRAGKRAAGHRDQRATRWTPADALALVGLDERLDHFPAQLSGGEQQRVAIARAIAKRPDVLLCDEPTGALDYETGKLVLEVLTRINRELGTTTVVITHNAAIAGMADRVVRIGSGRITAHRRQRRRGRRREQISW